MGRRDDERFDAALLEAMVLMTLADGRVAEDEVTRLRWFFSKLSGHPIDETVVRAAITEAQDHGDEIDERLAHLGEGCNDGQKRRMLKAAFAIASADGRVVDAEDALLRRIAQALQISPQTYRAVLSPMALARDVE